MNLNIRTLIGLLTLNIYKLSLLKLFLLNLPIAGKITTYLLNNIQKLYSYLSENFAKVLIPIIR